MCSFSFCISSPDLLYMFMFTLFHSWSYFMQYDQHYISTTAILNLMLQKTFLDKKLGRRDWRFSQNTICSYLKMNLNYSWFLHRTSASRVVMPIWFEYWDVQSSHFGQPCDILVTVSLSMFSSTPPLHLQYTFTLGPNFLGFLCHKFICSRECSTKHHHVIWNESNLFSLFYPKLRKTNTKKYNYGHTDTSTFIGFH